MSFNLFKFGYCIYIFKFPSVRHMDDFLSIISDKIFSSYRNIGKVISLYVIMKSKVQEDVINLYDDFSIEKPFNNFVYEYKVCK